MIVLDNNIENEEQDNIEDIISDKIEFENNSILPPAEKVVYLDE